MAVGVLYKTRRIYLVLIAMTLAAPAMAQQGALTVPRNLQQLTDRASDVVRGTVISAHMEKHPELTGLDTVVVKLRVQETLKGQAKGIFTFRQYIWDIRDRLDAAGYRKGQDVLLLMIGPSAYGLSGLAGMEQGRFRITRDSTGKEFAVNGSANFRLFEGISTELAKEGVNLLPQSASLVAHHRQGPVELSELTGLIRELVQRKP